MLCSVTHGVPVPSCASATICALRRPRRASARTASRRRRPATRARSARAPSVARRRAGDRRRSRTRAENFSSASTPQALATVVFQWPRCMRPSVPRTRRGMSSCHAGASMQREQQPVGVRVGGDHQPPQRVALLGGEAHRRALEVQARAQDLLGRASCARRAAAASAARLSTRYQSITAEVGHRFGSIAMLSSHFGVERFLAPRQRFERRDLADREIRGRQRANSARCGPRRSRSAPAPCVARESSGIAQPASSAIDSTYAVSVSLPSRSSGQYLTRPSRSR